MERFSMSQVVSLLNLPGPPGGRSAYYIQCPCCDDSPRKKHLNINLKKEVFRCPKCGVHGGIFDLYALYTGVPRDKVRETLVENLGTAEIRKTEPRKPLPEDVPESPLADIDIRHATYSALLSKLSLAEDHKENLIGRGFTESEIKQLGYKTAPVVGMSVIARQLQAEGFGLAGVPGFYRTGTDSWTFIQEKRGILIPVRDQQGRIQGLQIRRDNVSRRKFRWISSSFQLDGCGAVGWTHLAGTARSRIILTEGPMKADVIHALTGMTVLAVPGVNALTQLEIALKGLREEGLEEIKTAFDMDFATNHHVQNGYNDLLRLLDRMGFRYGTYLWDARYKGLDDYIWECCLQKQRS